VHGVLTGDQLMSIDGCDTRTLANGEARMMLRTAGVLDFKRPDDQSLTGTNGTAADTNGSAPMTDEQLAATPGLGSLALDLAMPKACAAAACAIDEATDAGTAMAAMSPKAPSALAAALGFFATDGVGYQKAPPAMPSSVRPGGGKGCPFDKGGGYKPVPKGTPMLVMPPALSGTPQPGAKGGNGPRVVMPPMLTGQAMATTDPGPQPEALPQDQDMDGWLELLRDGSAQQFRGANEWPEPPPFHRALHFAALPGEKCPTGKYPREALNTQLQMLFKTRQAMEPEVVHQSTALPKAASMHMALGMPPQFAQIAAMPQSLASWGFSQ